MSASSMKSILVVIDNMAVGGAARVASIIVQELSKRGYNVAVETDLDKGLFYPVNNDIKLYPRYNKVGRTIFGKIANRHRLMKRHRQTIREFNPDVIIAFTHVVFFYVWGAMLFHKKFKIIASDHTSMGRDLGIWHNFIRHRMYSFADAVTVLTEKDARLLGKRLPKKVVMPNPLTYVPLGYEPARKKTVLVAGRINYWRVKGLDRMIEIWGRVSSDYPDWTLEIAGPGSENNIAILNSFAAKVGVSDSIRYLGYIEEMSLLYQQSGIFALPSRVEGFPMVLIEAMSQGVASIAFSLDGAIDEIIDNGQDGVIVPDNDIDAFEAELRNMMSDDVFRKKLGNSASKNVSRFSAENVGDKWEQLIETLI